MVCLAVIAEELAILGISVPGELKPHVVPSLPVLELWKLLPMLGQMTSLMNSWSRCQLIVGSIVSSPYSVVVL